MAPAVRPPVGLRVSQSVRVGGPDEYRVSSWMGLLLIIIRSRRRMVNLNVTFHLLSEFCQATSINSSRRRRAAICVLDPRAEFGRNGSHCAHRESLAGWLWLNRQKQVAFVRDVVYHFWRNCRACWRRRHCHCRRHCLRRSQLTLKFSQQQPVASFVVLLVLAATLVACECVPLRAH